MFAEMIRLFQERSDFFLQLTLEHIAISLVAIVLAIVIGGAMGILIAEVDRMAQPTLLVVNFLYTIPSIAMFGFLLPFSGIGNTTAIIALTLYALLPMVKNTKNRAANFKIIAIMAVDKQLLFKGADTKFAAFTDAITAAKAGTQVIIGGSKGDDVATYEALIAALGLTKDQMNYITYNSTSEAITAQLGGHVDFVMAKPAAASEYVTSGDLKPVLALSKERFGGNLADAPKLSEIGRRAPTGELSEDGMGFLCRAGAGTGSSAKATSSGRSPLLESKLKY